MAAQLIRLPACIYCKVSCYTGSDQSVKASEPVTHVLHAPSRAAQKRGAAMLLQATTAHEMVVQWTNVDFRCEMGTASASMRNGMVTAWEPLMASVVQELP